MDTAQHIELVETYAAHNYKPLEVVVASAEGAWVEDVDGRRYLDLLAAYSAVNFGHSNPRLLGAARAQLDRVTLTSRAFHNDQLGPFCEDLATLCGMEMVLPMNTGAEAVETALKTARKWAYKVKGVAEGAARIITCAGNFHGRTTTIISFSTDPTCRDGFGPFTPGFDTVPFGDLDALAAAITPETAAFLVEPIQGEAGVVVPPAGYLRAARDLCRERGVLFIADEIQAGLGRCGATFCSQTEGVVPDMYVLGKALGGGVVPVSAVVSSREILGVFRPGNHGSTFGGNPLAAAVGREAVAILAEGKWQAHAAELGEYMFTRLRAMAGDKVKEIRGRGLWAGVEFHPEAGPAKGYCERLLAAGVLVKDTQKQTMRIAPPLVISREDLDWALERFEPVLS